MNVIGVSGTGADVVTHKMHRLVILLMVGVKEEWFC